MSDGERLETAQTHVERPGGARRTPELDDTFADPGAAPVARDSSAELERGAVVGRYIVLSVLGAGGMGVVYAAYDPELDRKLALKLVRPRSANGRDTEGRARMLREAQAIARLSHPNVISVFDVGTCGDHQIFVAMELVDGVTLTQWLRERTRTTGEIVEMFLQAGRGLASAHSVGLIHRDFKPENVLVGRDGRARVVDFGLVRELRDDSDAEAARDASTRPSDPVLATDLTQVGTVMGTPFYMAPEQRLQRPTDARSDQYSFCVALYEALADRLPFEGSSLTEITNAVLAAKEPPDFPPGRKLPAHVRAAVRRGLSLEPDKRFSTMDELLAELARNPRARMHRRLLGAMLVGLAAIAITASVVAMRDRPGARCETGLSRLAGVWDRQHRDALAAGFAATKAPYADGAVTAVLRRLDSYAEAWANSYEDSCKATHVRGEQSLDLLDLRSACLAARRSELAAIVELLTNADASTVATAHKTVAALTPVEDCNDTVTLQAQVKLPADPATRRTIAGIRDELAQTIAIMRAGHYDDASRRAEALLARAHATNYQPVEAEVGQVLAQIQGRSGDTTKARRSLAESFGAALASRHDDIAAQVAIRMVTEAANRHDIENGHAWVAIASALIDRLGNPPATRADLHSATGMLLSAEGKYPAAAAEHEKGLALRERVAPNSMKVAASLTSLAFVYDEIGRYAEARAAGERSLAIEQADLGPFHPEVASVLTNLGNIADDEGDAARATDYYTRALAILEQTVPAGDDPAGLANVLNNLGVVAAGQKRYEEAMTYQQRALEIRQKIDPDGPDVALSLNNIADLEMIRGDAAKALVTFRRALAISERRLGPDHPYVGDALTGVGRVSWQLHDLATSRSALERALAIRRAGARPEEIAEVELALARTLWDSANHKRAVELATSARAAYAESRSAADPLADAEAWLASHH